MPVSLRRSALYVPASNTRALEKAQTLPADMLLLDLEDSVAPEVKQAARESAFRSIAKGGFGAHREVLVRVNAPDTQWWTDDLAALAAACKGGGAPDGLLVPKIRDAADVMAIAAQLRARGLEESLSLWLMMETPASVLNAAAIGATAGTVSGLAGFVTGTNDLLKESGAKAGPRRETLVPWLMTLIAAAKANGLAILDGVFNRFRDREGYLGECAQGRAMGMDGKTLIHPSQIPACNEIFSPMEEEIAAARAIVDAFAQDSAQGKGAINIDGRMVERLDLAVAEALLARAEAVAALSAEDAPPDGQLPTAAHAGQPAREESARAAPARTPSIESAP